MDKPYSAKDVAFELYIRNFPMDRMLAITEADEQTINNWIAEGNWLQLKQDLDAAPILRDLGRRIEPERARLILLGFVAHVLNNNFELGTQLFRMNKKFLSGEEPFPEMPGTYPVALN